MKHVYIYVNKESYTKIGLKCYFHYLDCTQEIATKLTYLCDNIIDLTVELEYANMATILIKKITRVHI